MVGCYRPWRYDDVTTRLQRSGGRSPKRSCRLREELVVHLKEGRFLSRQSRPPQCTKEEYLQKLKDLNDYYKPLKVMIETVAAQEYLAQDDEKHMPVRRVKRTTDKVARACWLQAFFENGQIIMPDKSLVSDYSTWQALQDELLLFPQTEHDDLFDGLQTMMEGALSVHSNTGEGCVYIAKSLRDYDSDFSDLPERDWDDLFR